MSASRSAARSPEGGRRAAHGRDTAGLIGLREIAAALDGWQREPGEASRARLIAAFGHAVEEAGLAGGHLHLHAPPIAEVEAGWGSLAGEGQAGNLRTFDLRLGDRTLAHLNLDAAPAADQSAENLARGLEIVIEAAWSKARASRSSEEMAALDAATRGIAGVLDLDRVLQLITDRVRELAHAQYAALGIAEQEGGFERFITSGIGRTERERMGAPPKGLGLLGVIAAADGPIRVADIAADPRRHGFPPNHPEMHSLLGVPVSARGRSIGRLYLTNKQPAGEFTSDDERLVEMFALHAGIAIENARLHEQVQRLAIVEERERIGRDLHDGIIQSIYAVGLSLEDVPELMADEPDEARQRVERAIDSLDQSIRDIRNFIFGLRPELLEQAGLFGGLAALADEFRVNSMIDVDVESEGIEESDLAPDQTNHLLAIAREGLSNIARHSKATRGLVHVTAEGDTIRLAISDNGVGFDPDRQRAPAHQGLINMRDRVASMGGRMQLVSEPGAGTRIIVEVARRPEQAAGDQELGHA
jgi:signal transduction histidine kinase